MEIKHFHLSEREWRYKGEGNAHLTLTLPEDQLVLRLGKVPLDSSIETCESPTTVELEVEFIKAVMTKLFSKTFVIPPQTVLLNTRDIENVNKKIFCDRPEYRLNKKVGKCTATLWPDLCFLPPDLSNPRLPTFSIEIKPKQGTFALSDQGNQQCLFCLKQNLKLSKGIVDNRSSYCPLNLYSGDKEKMMSALKGLLHTPQNNFKIYKDGEAAFDGKSLAATLEKTLVDWLQPVSGTSLEDRLCAILLDVLTRELAVDEKTKDDDMGWLNDGPPLLCRLAYSMGQRSSDHTNEKSRSSCYWGPQNLTPGSVLGRLSSVQALGICGHAAAYELYRQEVKLGSDDYTYVKDIIEAGCSSALSPLQCYLVAAVARDSSIMIAFQRVQNAEDERSPRVLDQASGQEYVFQIRLMDLDPKPLSCVKKHRERNQDIKQAHKQMTKK